MTDTAAPPAARPGHQGVASSTSRWSSLLPDMPIGLMALIRRRRTVPRMLLPLRARADHREASASRTDGTVRMNIRLLLIDDFPLIREGFAAALETDPGLKIVGQADNGEAGLRLARELEPDVVVLDLSMPGMGGMTVLEKLRTESPETKVLVVTATEK